MESSLTTQVTFAESQLQQALEFAKQEFKLGSESDPGSLRSQLLSVEKQTNQKPKELENLIELPSSCESAWVWFWDLSNSRTEGFSGSNPITYSDIKCYFDLQDIKPLDYEVSLIKRFDVAFLNAQRSKSEK
ncbi:MAG: phage tail assembly chaperone [Waterburya sp.]